MSKSNGCNPQILRTDTNLLFTKLAENCLGLIVKADDRDGTEINPFLHTIHADAALRGKVVCIVSSLLRRESRLPDASQVYPHRRYTFDILEMRIR